MPSIFPTLTWVSFFGLSAALLSVMAYVPYILQTLRGHTRPHRASWLIWSVLATISYFSQSYEGATASLCFSGAQATCTTVIFLLAVVRGQGKFMTRTDAGVLGVAGIGVAIWYGSSSAAFALVIAITISLMGGMMTIRKTYWFPDTETMSTWTLSFIASCFALAAVGTWDWILMAYPLYLFVQNGAILVAWVLAHTPAQRQRQEKMGLFTSVRGGHRVGE